MKTISYKSLAVSALGLLAAAGSLTSCDDEKIYTTGYQEVIMVSEINMEVSDTLSLAVDMDSTLVYTVGPENADNFETLWQSTNENVATVDADGTIHAKGLGFATISLVPANGFGATGAVVVKVIPEIIKATDVVLTNTTPITNDEGKIYLDDRLQLAYEILPADHTYNRVTWSSSDESVATVDQNGFVNCVGVGKAVIRCGTHDRSGVYGEYPIEVSDYVFVDRVNIEPLDAPLSLPGYGVPLKYTTEPAGAAAGTIIWESSDEAVATVSRGVVVARGFGQCEITARSRTTNIETTIQVTVEDGFYYWCPANGFSGWVCSNNDAPEVRGDKYWRIHFPASTGKYRRDIRMPAGTNHDIYSSYPVYAFRTTLPKGGDNTWDVRNSGTPHDKTGVDLPDGTRLIVGDFTGKYDGMQSLNLFQLKLADIPNGNVNPDAAWFDIYWIGSFKTRADAEAFARAQVAAEMAGN